MRPWSRRPTSSATAWTAPPCRASSSRGPRSPSTSAASSARAAAPSTRPRKTSPPPRARCPRSAKWIFSSAFAGSSDWNARPDGSSFADQAIHLPGFYPGNDRPDDDLLAPLVRVQVTAAAGIAVRHAAAHRHQILAGISLHGRVRRVRASVVLVVNMKDRSGDGAVGKAGKRIRVPEAIVPVHRRRMDAAADLVAEILREPPRADRSNAVAHDENPREAVLVPELRDDASHVVRVLLRRAIAVEAARQAATGFSAPLVGGAVHDHQGNPLFRKNLLILPHERLQVARLVRDGLDSRDTRVTPEIQKRSVSRLGRLGQDRPLEHGGFLENAFRPPPVDVDQHIVLRTRERNAEQ